MTQEEKKKWFENELVEILGEDCVYKLEPCAYDDRFEPESILSAYEDENETVNNYLTNLFYETGSDFYGLEDIENRILEDLQGLFTRIEKTDEARELKEYMREQIEELGYLDFFYEHGFNGCEIATDAYANANYKLNLMFSTKEEANFEMASISTFFNEIFFGDGDYENVKEYSDNALMWVINQQGYTLSDVLKFAKGEFENDFLKSVKYELNNHSYDMGVLTVLCSASGESLIESLQKIKDKEGFVTLPKDTMLGIFNQWNGSGSVLEIELEKPLVIPCDMIKNLQVEGARNNSGYTVNEVYGLIGSCYEAELKTTDTPPVLAKEPAEKKINNIER